MKKQGVDCFYIGNQGNFDRLALRVLREAKTSYPHMKISFDGIGHHDWLRDHKGAEENALRAIRLCVQNGFRVMVQTSLFVRSIMNI